MAERFDIMTPRKKKDGGTMWVRIGTAWFNDNGGKQLVFDALPIPDSEGRVVANLFEPKPRDGGQGGFTPAPRNTRQDDDLGGDGIPF